MFLLTLIYLDNKKCGWSTKSPNQRAFTILNRFKSAVDGKISTCRNSIQNCVTTEK